MPLKILQKCNKCNCSTHNDVTKYLRQRDVNSKNTLNAYIDQPLI